VLLHCCKADMGWGALSSAEPPLLSLLYCGDLVLGIAVRGGGALAVVAMLCVALKSMVPQPKR
jgi:hypothetical protein